MEIAPPVNAPQSGCSPTCLREKSAASSRRRRTPNNPWCRARSETCRLSRRGRAGPNSRNDACRDVATARQYRWAYRERGSNRFRACWRSGPCCPCRATPGHQRIEEVAGTARMNARPRLQRLKVERSFGENAEHVELGGDEQHLGFPKQIGGADDTVRKSFGWLRHVVFPP